jgi:hypothetical protein
MCDAAGVVDRHVEPVLAVRPPVAVRTDAERVLADRGREMTGFIVACLARLAADPDLFLDELAPHWPAPKPPGRPRRSGPADDA